MRKAITKKLMESLFSVLPITLIVLCLYFTPLLSLTSTELAAFLISSVLLIVGIGLFNMGADLAMTPMGEQIGSGLTKSKKSSVLFIVCFLMGLLITVAEPDLSVLASQVADVVPSYLLIGIVGVGVGVFLVLAVAKIVFKKSLSSMLFYFYMVLFALVALVVINDNTSLLPLSFDSGGVTTGPITVPFIMALGVGIATTLGGQGSGENSFGLVSMCSVGPVLAVAALGIFIKGDINYQVPDYSVESHIGANILPTVLSIVKEVSVAIGLIAVFFIILQLTCLHLPKKRLIPMAVGIAYTVVGLVIFLTAATVGFMPVGYRIGLMLGEQNEAVLSVFAFVIGTVVVLAEPAVHVLNKQVEEITGGAISKGSMLIALSLGVGISILLSVIRIIFGFSILYYVIPGYFLSLGLSFFVPPIYTAVAFDSGGVASGPLTSSFILPFAVGVCCVLRGESSVLSYGFGIVAMVAMTPLITIQALGFRSVVSKKLRQGRAIRRILTSDDEQIIDFEVNI